jgi:hypothetical protein
MTLLRRRIPIVPPTLQQVDAMPYTVWLRGEKIGQTMLEYEDTGPRRAGAFYPTDFGVQVLPSITAMAPALFDFDDLCRRQGLNTEDASPQTASAAMAAFGGTPEGQRIMAAAKQIAALEVRDESGRIVRWESLAITDLEWLEEFARKRNPDVLKKVDALPPHDPIKFMISLKLKRSVPRPWRLGEMLGARH